MNLQDEKQLLRILQESYVLDMYVSQVPKLHESVFHPEFQMLIPEFDGRTGQISDVRWLKAAAMRRSEPKALNDETKFNTSVLDITGKVAVCKVEAFRNGHLQYSDYVTFSKIGREWKVVAKAFHHHLPASVETS